MENEFIEYIKERFGFTPEDFKGYVFASDGKRVYVTTAKCAEEENVPKKFHSYGIVAGRIQRNGRIIKPTTNFFQMFGQFAKKNIIEFTKEQKEHFIRGFDVELEDYQKKDAEKGYVIIKWEGHILGCGLLRSGVVLNQLPKTRILRITEEDFL